MIKFDLIKRLVIFLLILVIPFFSQAQEITLKFEFNGYTIDSISNKLSLYFVFNKESKTIIVKPKIKENTFTFPDLYGFKRGHIVFRYEEKFYGIGEAPLNFNQNMIWTFGFDDTPRDNKHFMKELESENLKAISYLIFNPKEQGAGTISVISINNIDKYNKKCKQLVY